MEKILIADDEQLMRQLVIDFLKPEGYEILEASDGKEALDIYDKEHPDLILLDVMMPGYDGWTVCREIRRESTVPIMMLTAKGEEIDQLFAYDLGADEYITKPFSPSEMVARVKAHLSRYERLNRKRMKPTMASPSTAMPARSSSTARTSTSVRRNTSSSIIS